MTAENNTNHHPVHQLLEVIGQKRSVLIMCHNNPDPDSIAAAAGLKSLLYQVRKRRAVIGYGGIIGRAENREFVKRLKIDMVHVRDIDFSRYTIICLIDSQPHTGNNAIPADILPQIVIDHHPLKTETKKCAFYDVRPRYGSSSTILTEYLQELNCKIDKKLATALFYGLKTDTFDLLRSSVKADLDAFTYLFPRMAPRTLAAIENPSIPKSYYLKFADTIGNSLQYKDAIIADMGDLTNPDTVAEMADFLLRMEGIRWTLCFGEYQNALILSVRTSRRGWLASLVVLKIIQGLGNGGGHEKAAAGRISLSGRDAEERESITRQVHRRFLDAVGAAGTDPKPLMTTS